MFYHVFVFMHVAILLTVNLMVICNYDACLVAIITAVIYKFVHIVIMTRTMIVFLFNRSHFIVRFL